MTRVQTDEEKRAEDQEHIRNVYANSLSDYINEVVVDDLDQTKVSHLWRRIRETMKQEYNAGYLQGASDTRYN